MKKILLGLFVFGLVFGLYSFAPKAHAENIFTRFLSMGSKGKDVKALQEVLKNEGLLGAAATGYYGALTKEAVTQLQTQNNLEPVGVVGPKTLALVTTKATTTKTETTTTTKVTPAVATVCTPTTPASITVTSPNGGETYVAGQQIKVTWTSCNVPATKNISIMVTMNNTSIASTAGATPNDGIEAIDLPTQANLPTGTAMVYGNVYKVNLFVSGMSVFDASDNLFMINGGNMAGCTPTSAPSMQLISPNGGQVYTLDQSVTINWVSCNMLPYTSVVTAVHSYDLNGNPVASFPLTGATPNDGQEVANFPANLLGYYGVISGNHFKISVAGIYNNPLGDNSDNFFTINPAVALCPNGMTLASGCTTPPITPTVCVNTNLNTNLRTLSFSELNQLVQPTVIANRGTGQEIGEFKINVGQSTICDVNQFVIYSPTNPGNDISNIWITDLDTNQTIASAPVNFTASQNHYKMDLAITMPFNLYALSVKKIALFANIKSNANQESIFTLGIGNISSQFGGISATGLPVFQNIGFIQ